MARLLAPSPAPHQSLPPQCQSPALPGPGALALARGRKRTQNQHCQHLALSGFKEGCHHPPLAPCPPHAHSQGHLRRLSGSYLHLADLEDRQRWTRKRTSVPRHRSGAVTCSELHGAMHRSNSALPSCRLTQPPAGALPGPGKLPGAWASFERGLGAGREPEQISR